MYKNNSRDSSKFKGCSPLQLSCNLTENFNAIGYYSYTNRYATFNGNNMKKIYLFFIFLSFLLSELAYCQTGKLGFDNTSGIDYGIDIIMDSSSSNFWKIGKPNGIVFNEAFQSENAVYIDKNLMNSDTLSSSFTIKYHIIPPLDPHQYCFLHFYYMIDADTSESAEFFVSYDYGKSWNSIFDTNLWTFSYYTRIADSHIYKEPPISGYHADWISCLIDFRFSLYYKVADEPDTIYFRFKFNAIKEATTEGIILDNIRANIAYTDVEDEKKNKIVFQLSSGLNYPIHIKGNISDYMVSIFDLYGRKLINDFRAESSNINLSDILNQQGFYIVRIYNQKTKESKVLKIIK